MKSAQSVGRGIHQHAHGRSMGDPARATDRDRTGHADVEGRAAAPGRPVPDRAALGAGLAADGAVAMRYRLMATYLGVPYHAGLGPDGNEATLISPGPPPDELGFIPAGGHWRKQVNLTDLGALWQSRVVGEYRGEPCLVLDDLGDRLHIAYQGRDSARARQLGYWESDREVLEVVGGRQDSTGL